ncbi:protein ycf2 b [Phtheirospermum japonicum]|uniref:Protein ycf2 b n=1 Tax=Phtheirospermum japonicum TaxID=374723 RepID=A0A830BEP3_9LAMI|nr:protein ycf2 b [Phtheirospermum japonicum]
MKPSLELRSYSKRKISNIWSFFLYIIWMIRSVRTVIENCFDRLSLRKRQRRIQMST